MKKIPHFLAETVPELPQNKISVVVAVYNIEKYIARCVTSIQQQTFKNLEIILVDDGSTDSSPEILEQMGLIDSRIKIIHKENGGLSDARNAGTDIASGTYITYVDGDDWIEPDMYETMLSAILQYQADCVICGYKQIYHNRIIKKEDGSATVFEGDEVLRVFVEEDEQYQIQNAAWNKLYRRDLTSQLRFPKGKLYEDIVYTTKLLSMVKRSVYLDRTLYNYVISRSGSIMSKGLNKRIFTDQLPAYQEKRAYLIESGHSNLANINDYFVNKRLMQYYNSIAWNNSAKAKKYRKKIKEQLYAVKDRVVDIYGCNIANPNEEKKYRLFLYSTFLYRIVIYINEIFLIPYKQGRNKRKGKF